MTDIASIYDDFRASLSPATAARRLGHFKQRLEAHDITSEQRELRGGEKFGYSSAAYAYGQLLRAHVDFAIAQIREREREDCEEIGRRAAMTASACPATEEIAGERPVRRRWFNFGRRSG